MAQAGHLTPTSSATGRWLDPVTRLRVIILVTIVAIWEATAASGLLFRDVVPSLVTVGRALAELLAHPDLKWPIELGGRHYDLSIPAFYWHLYVTIGEIVGAMNWFAPSDRRCPVGTAQLNANTQRIVPG